MLPYSFLQETLQIQESRDLELLILEGIYNVETRFLSSCSSSFLPLSSFLSLSFHFLIDDCVESLYWKA